MIADDHLGNQAVEAYAEACGEEAALAPLEKMFNDPDEILAKKRLALLKSERINREVAEFEGRVLDPGGLEMRMECVIPLDMFIHRVLHQDGSYWENEDVLRDYKRYNREKVFKEPVKRNQSGWRAEGGMESPALSGSRSRSESVVLTDRRGNAL